MTKQFMCAVSAVCLSTLMGFAASAEEEKAAVEAAKAAAERFQDVDVALAEGYIPDPSNHCVTAEAEGLPAELGAMGIHYLNPGLLGLTGSEPRVDGTGIHTDFENPAILLYEPQADGSLELVGVENLVFEKAWKEAGEKYGHSCELAILLPLDEAAAPEVVA